MPTRQSVSSRTLAAEILCSFFERCTPITPILEKACRKVRLLPSDRALVMELVYGVIRHRQELDRILTLLSTTPLKKIDPFVHYAIAVGLYQLFFLDRIPDSAAVNEAVESCKQHRPPPAKRLQGFVNGVLRQAVRQKEALTVKMTTDAQGNSLYNHPKWLYRRWAARFDSREAAQICQINNRQALLSLRVNSRRITRPEFCALLSQTGYSYHTGIAPDAVLLENGGNITALPGYADGFFQVQDQAAQCASMLLAPFAAGDRIIDGCAGLGGKTSHLLQLMLQVESGSDCTLYAVEPHKKRFALLHENITRLFGEIKTIPPLHFPRYIGHNLDFLSLSPEDILPCSHILLDVPCSGTGVIRRHPDIRWNRTEEELQRYQQRQRELLNHAVRFMAQEGILVYATCSLEEEENETVIEQFLAEHTDFTVTDPRQCLPESAHAFLRGNFFAPLPHEDIDGFFVVRLTRNMQ